MWRKGNESTAFLWESQLTPVETWTYYYAYYLPSVGYAVACSSLTYAQLDRVQQKAMHIIITKCRYNRYTKRKIIYGPLEFGGANFCHLYLQQGVGLVTSFLQNWRNNSVTGRRLRCALSWTQMTAETSQSILIDVHSALPHLVSKWLASLRTFLSKIEATIELESPIHISWTI